MRRFKLLQLGLSAAMALSLLNPTSARAQIQHGIAVVDFGRLEYFAVTGLRNHVLVEPGQDPGTYLISDTAGLSAGDGCESVTAEQVLCQDPVDDPIRYMWIVTADRHDTIHYTIPAGGPPGDLHGGGGPDSLISGDGADSLDGGPGADSLRGGPGGDRLIGGSGPDVFYGGAGDSDAAIYETRNDVTATIDNVANDGEAGEGDNILSTVERIVGGNGDDTLTGPAPAGLLGNRGDDHLTSTPETPYLSGDIGNDTLDSADGAPNSDYCGFGIDSVLADAVDYVNTKNCEDVTIV